MKEKIFLRDRIRLNLMEAMKKAGYNQVQLARELGISKGTVNNWIKGNNSPDVDTVPALCEVLGIEIVDLFISHDVHSEPCPNTPLDLDPQEKQLLDKYRALNEEGQEKLLGHADDLVATGKYKKCDKLMLDSKEA